MRLGTVHDLGHAAQSRLQRDSLFRQNGIGQANPHHASHSFKGRLFQTGQFPSRTATGRMDRNSGSRYRKRQRLRSGPATPAEQQTFFNSTHPRANTTARHVGVPRMRLWFLPSIDEKRQEEDVLLPLFWNESISTSKGALHQSSDSSG